MKRATQIASAAMLAVFTLVAVQVTAQQPDTRDRTFLTFSNTVELPELTLPAGTYVFKLADTPSRNVVQVWSQDEQELLGQWLYVQAERNDPVQETVVMFRETPEGTTPAVQYWFYPGERIGKEFIYPRDQAERIAARTGQPVMTDNGERVEGRGEIAREGEQPADRADAAVSPDAQQPRAEAERPVGTTGIEAERRDDVDRDVDVDVDRPDVDVDADRRGVDVDVDRGDVDVDVERRGEAAVAPAQRDDAQQPQAQQQPVQQPRAEPQAQQQPARPSVLPQTASPLALSALLGLLSLAGAFGVRAFRG